MSLSRYLIEAEDELGEIKTDLPDSEGLENSISAADQFVDAVDGDADDIDLSIHDTVDEEFLFDEDVNFDSTITGEPVDPNTIPQDSKEADVFSPEEDFMDDPSAVPVSDEELAEDDDELSESVEESCTGWDDLF